MAIAQTEGPALFAHLSQPQEHSARRRSSLHCLSAHYTPIPVLSSYIISQLGRFAIRPDS
jgi:hypothetical protein